MRKACNLPNGLWVGCHSGMSENSTFTGHDVITTLTSATTGRLSDGNRVLTSMSEIPHYPFAMLGKSAPAGPA